MAGVTANPKSHVSLDMGMHTEALAGRSQQRFFDISEEHTGFGYPDAADVDFNKRAEIDCASREPRDINLEIRSLIKQGYGTIVLNNPGAKHSLAVGILNRLNLIIKGSCGYFACGLIDGPNVRISGRVGWACGENMLAGTIVIEKNAGSQFGAALRGGDLVCKGSVGGRTGVDQKGGTIIVGGDTGAFTGFMMQRGRMVICGNAGKNLGDSMYDGTIYIGGEPRSLGVDAVWAEMMAADREWLARKLRIYDMMPARGLEHFRKIVAGKQLWNYDNLEPSEKKLVL
jgi:glutamate synthase domain-containing protein 3